MTTFLAIEILESGAEGDPVEAMQHLIDTGIVWQLQGSYGRAAAAMIEAGECTLPVES